MRSVSGVTAGAKIWASKLGVGVGAAPTPRSAPDTTDGWPFFAAAYYRVHSCPVHRGGGAKSRQNLTCPHPPPTQILDPHLLHSGKN